MENEKTVSRKHQRKKPRVFAAFSSRTHRSIFFSQCLMKEIKWDSSIEGKLWFLIQWIANRYDFLSKISYGETLIAIQVWDIQNRKLKQDLPRHEDEHQLVGPGPEVFRSQVNCDFKD
ncbi:hypothetical protein C5167_038853 [Papaver somniferum]|uniref:Uncharacterized protein n=1 Tax=Papaver somniferum TaxID=3469 RepID=A0A4Y7IAF1_PAPSO|nr:hypothetical protein C5167_038853 [Papaver somniferum]